MSLFNAFAIRFAKNPPDSEHLYGHGKMEAIASTAQGMIIFVSGIYIIYESIRKIITPEEINYLGYSIFVMIISIVFTLGLVIYLKKVYQKSKNTIIYTDTLHYQIDLFTNIAIFVSLGIIFLFPGMEIIDGIIGAIIGFYICYEAVKIIKRGTDILLDTRLNEHSQIIKVLEGYSSNHTILGFHETKSRFGGNKNKFVEFHFELDKNTSIYDAHHVGDLIENDIKQLDQKAYWNIVWHVDYKKDQ